MMHYNPANDPAIVNGVQEAFGLSIGDTVEYTNPNGVVIGPRTVVGFCMEDGRVYINSDSPWFPVDPCRLRKLKHAYTQAEFDALPVDENGVKHCPTGDYTQIKQFGDKCSFGAHSVFSKHSDFGKGCSFGEGCSFGARCRFGVGCRFGERCSFGERCRFGEECSFENGRITNGKYTAADRIGSEARKTYFFKGDEGFFARAGCWFGSLEDFKVRVSEVHGGTKHERAYLLAMELAKEILAD